MKRVLVLFSTNSDIVRRFDELGIECWTVDKRMPEDGRTERHILPDSDWPGEPDLVIAHPPCTYLTVSGAWAFKDGPYHQAVKPGTKVGAERREAREQALSLFETLLSAQVPYCIENPAKSFVCTRIRPPDQVVQPYQFGVDASKATGLWLGNGLPKLVLDSADYIPPRMVNGKPRWENQSPCGAPKAPPSEDRWLDRSRLVRCFVPAMVQQWGAWLLGET